MLGLKPLHSPVRSHPQSCGKLFSFLFHSRRLYNFSIIFSVARRSSQNLLLSIDVFIELLLLFSSISDSKYTGNYFNSGLCFQTCTDSTLVSTHPDALLQYSEQMTLFLFFSIEGIFFLSRVPSMLQ